MAPAHHAVAQLAILLQRAGGSCGLGELSKCPVQCVAQFTALGNDTAEGDGLWCSEVPRDAPWMLCRHQWWKAHLTSLPPAQHWSSGYSSTVRPQRFAWQVQSCGFPRVPKGTPLTSSHHNCVLTQPKADGKRFLLGKAASRSMSWALSHTTGMALSLEVGTMVLAALPIAH